MYAKPFKVPWITDYDMFRKATNDGFEVGYIYKDQPLVHARIDTPMVRTGARDQMFIKDLEFAQAAVKLAIGMRDERDAEGVRMSCDLDNPRDVQFRALFISAVVSYCRVFTNGSPLDYRHVFKDDGEKYLAAHLWIRNEVRDGFIAHKGDVGMELSAGYAVFSTPNAKHTVHGFEYHATFVAALTSECYAIFLEVINYVMAHIKKKRAMALQKILDKELAPNLADLYQRAHYVRKEGPPPRCPPIGTPVDMATLNARKKRTR